VVVSGGEAPSASGGGDGAAAADQLDLSSGGREFLTRESAEELLAPMLAPGSKITSIRFSTKSFGVEAAEVAARAIENVAASLLVADMSDIIAGRPGVIKPQSCCLFSPFLSIYVRSCCWLLHAASLHKMPSKRCAACLSA
jgi:hypothetical protein